MTIYCISSSVPFSSGSVIPPAVHMSSAGCALRAVIHRSRGARWAAVLAVRSSYEHTLRSEMRRCVGWHCAILRVWDVVEPTA
jgi:hypothetical protein